MQEGQPERQTIWQQHVAAAMGFAALAVLWTFPLAASLSTDIPGSDAGDNVIFLWNFWWMRAALAGGHEIFSTPAIFAPWGVDLTLHTHTALPALVGATALADLPLPAALNLTIITAVALGGFCAYWLAWRVTADRPGAVLAGIVFGCSPFIAARLQGHFNLVHAWTIPLFTLAALEYVAGRKRGWGIVAGLTLGATAYIDYYFVLYQLALLGWLIIWESRRWTIGRAGPTDGARLAARAVLAGAIVAAAAAAAIAVTGGFQFEIGGLRMSAHGIFNPLQIAWVLLGVWGVLALGPRIRSSPREGQGLRRACESALVVGGVFVLLAAPLLWRGVLILVRGEYVSQDALWRSGPSGIDAATLVAGHPFHGLWGEGVRGLLERRGIDVMESSGWLGLVPLGLGWIAIRRHAEEARRWVALGGTFLLWALGPHLMVLGLNVGLILPHALLRYLPIVSNARMPGRAMVVVYLALAILSAIAAARLRMPPAPRAGLVAALALGVMLDYLPAPLPLTALHRPAIYTEVLAQSGPGTVLELPLGLRDGFGERGALDERVLWYQTLHGRPLAGGFVARLPPSTRSAYDADPLLSALLALSAGEDIVPPGREQAVALLRQHGIAFIVLDRLAAPARLLEYIDDILSLTSIATEDGRTLFVVDRS